MVNDVPPLSHARRSVAMVQFPHRSHMGARGRMLRALRVSRAPAALASYELFLCNSEFTREHIRDAAGRGRRDRGSARGRARLPPRGEREPLILSVGRFFSDWHSKNQHVLRGGVRRARRAGLVAGAGGRGGRSRLRGARPAGAPRACRSSCASTFHATSCSTSTRAPRCSGTPRATARTPGATPSGWSTSASRRSRRWRTARSRWSFRRAALPSWWTTAAPAAGGVRRPSSRSGPAS